MSADNMRFMSTISPKIAAANAGERLRRRSEAMAGQVGFAGKSRVVLQHRPGVAQFAGSMVRPKVSMVFAFLVLSASGGCVPLNYGVFISTLDEDVTLEVRNLQSHGFGDARRFKIPRRGEKKIDYCIPEVAALDTSGHVLFRQVLPVLRPEIDNFQKPRERKIYFLLTREGAYPIPVVWRERWRDHTIEIAAGYDVRAARQRLVREGALKE